MIKALILLVLSIAHVYGNCKWSPTTASGSQAPRKICSGDLIFEDNFDTLDSKKWQHEQTLAGGGNWEFQWYSDDKRNSYIQNGNLHIKPTLLADEYGEDFLSSGTIEIPADKCTLSQWYGCKRTGTPKQILNPIKSARLRTLNSFAFKFGKVEVRAKVPVGDWLWPAIWMLPEEFKYGGWPASGEIDIMESRGNRQLYIGNANIGVEQVGSTLHWGPNPQNNRWPRTHFDKNLAQGYNADFHNYQLEWTSEHLKFLIDNVHIGTVTPPEGGFWQLGDLAQTGLNNPWTNSKMAPFDQEFHLILNLAIGGVNYFPDNANNIPNKKPWSNSADNAQTTFWQAKNEWLPTWNRNTDDSHLQIDYVRVWAI